MKKDIRFSLRLPAELKSQLEAKKNLLLLKSKKERSLNDLIVAAIELFLSPEDEEAKEAAMARRLDRLDRRFYSIEKGQDIIAEALALYIRTYLTTTTEVPDDQAEAAAAAGGRRWSRFMEILSGKLGSRDTLMATLPDTVFKPSDFKATEKGSENDSA